MTSDIAPEVGPQPGARALASRRDGARSRGPKTVAGLASSSQNALKHGLRGRRLMLLADEDAAEYRAFQAAARALPRLGAGRAGAPLRADLGGRCWQPGARAGGAQGPPGGCARASRAHRAGRRPGAPAAVPRHDQTNPRNPCRTIPWVAGYAVNRGRGGSDMFWLGRRPSSCAGSPRPSRAWQSRSAPQRLVATGSLARDS